MSNPNQKSLTVEHEGYTFQFKIPGIRDDARIGAYVQSLIRQDAPGVVKEENLDQWSQYLYRTIAVFALFLEKSSAPWAYIEDPNTKQPIVNIDDLPPEALQVYLKYVSQSNEFFRARAEPAQPPG